MLLGLRPAHVHKRLGNVVQQKSSALFSHSAAHVTVLHANYAILHKEPDEPKSHQKSAVYTEVRS